MSNAHYFVLDDLSSFLANLEARRYARHFAEEQGQEWTIHSKTLSEAVTKFYSFVAPSEPDTPIRIRVTYKLVKEGKPLARLAVQLKSLNEAYQKALPVWKTKRPSSAGVREQRWREVQRYLHMHAELIDCFKYQADDRLTEGNHSFNLLVASTPREQRICFDFIKALAEAFAPQGIIRGRRQADSIRQQRNGWIKRYADMHKKRGWTPLEIAREIQKELRNGTWNERSRLQYNLANNTICKIAGLKIHPSHAHLN